MTMVVGHFLSTVTNCSSLSDPPNGHVSYSGSGTTANYTCDSGYTINGNGTHVCQNNGSGLGVLPHVNVRRTPRHWYHVSVLQWSHCIILMQVTAD